MLHEQITRSVIGAAYEVFNRLGSGFHESSYQKALAVELSCRDLTFEREVPIPLIYRGIDVGDYFADFIVEGLVIVETKALVEILQAHANQLLNYLRVSGLEVGLLLNFGARNVGVVRKIWTEGDRGTAEGALKEGGECGRETKGS